jgi:hypothetical protein
MPYLLKTGQLFEESFKRKSLAGIETSLSPVNARGAVITIWLVTPGIDKEKLISTAEKVRGQLDIKKNIPGRKIYSSLPWTGI